MARTTGTFDFSANFEVNKTAPLDARLTVEDKSELTGLPFAYIGMVVAVTSDSTATNNGVYVLDDTDGTTLSNWKLVGANSGSFSGSFEGDGSGLTGIISDDATKAQTVETIATTNDDEHFLTFVDSNNGTAAAEIVYTTDGIKVAPGTSTIIAGIVSANSFSGSFSGSFEGDGSGLTGVAPTAGDGILVNGTTVSVDSGSLIQTATNNSAYNVLFNNSTTPFAIDNTTSHFSYNPGLNQLRVSGSIELGSDDGSGYSPEIRFKVSGSDPSGRMVVFEKQNGVEFASIEIDNNFDLVNVLDPDGKRGVEQSFLWRTSGSAADGLVTRMELTGDSGDLTVYGIISGSSLETSGQVTIGDVSAADTAERTALVIDGSGNVQSLELGDAVTTDSGSLTVAKADGFYLTDNSSTDSDYNVIFSTDAPGNYIGAQGDGDSFTYNPSNNTLTVGKLVGNVTGTATSASYVSAGNIDGTVASATNAESASHVAAAFDTISVTNATITLTDMAGNTSSGTVNNVSNATTAVNATNATNASNINIDQATDDDSYHIVFTATTSGNAALLVDNNGKLTYNPNTDLLSVGNDLSVGGDATIGDNLTVGGDLTVNGTTTTLNTANLEVEDAFILLNSGSASIRDSGIIFGGSEGTASSGSALIWDASYGSNDGRLRVATGTASTNPNGIASSATSPIDEEDIAYSIAGVFEGTEAAAADAQADHPGNIRIESNEIYIYV